MEKQAVRGISVSKLNAIEDGFAGFNNAPHLCVDVPDGFFTISARTPNGKKVTFAFCPVSEGIGHHCVDICHHGEKLSANGAPLQEVSVRGQGPLLYAIGRNAEVPATLTILSLKE